MTDNPSSSVPPLCRTCGCHPPSFKNFEKQVHCEICVPASSVPVSKGEEIAAGWFDNATGDLSISLVQHQALVSLIDSALASQEARHRQEMEEAEDRLDEEMAAHETTRAMCSEQQRRAEAAEQREREAGERERAIGETLCRVAQVFDGWHADGTAWTEWDESVRREVSDALIRNLLQNHPIGSAVAVKQRCACAFHKDHDYCGSSLCECAAALAAQEARHFRVAEEWARNTARREARHRQEMEEAKREGDEESAGLRVVISDKERLIDNWHARARAAEQREREAGERAKALAKAIEDVSGEVSGILRGMKSTDRYMLHGGIEHHVGSPCAVCAALAAIHSAPSPVSAPPMRIKRTEADNARLVRGADEGEIALIVFAPGKPGEGGYASVDFGYEDGRFWASFGRFDPAHGFYPGEFVQIATLEDLYREWDAALKEIARRKAASPVEPGSDPQEPETR